MTYAVVLFTLIAFYLFGRRFARLGFLPGAERQAANPYLIVILFLSLQVCDFAYMRIADFPNVRGIPVLVPPFELGLSALYFSLCAIGLLGGALIGNRLPQRGHFHVQPVPPADRLSAGIVAAVLVPIAIVAFVAAVGIDDSIAETSASKAVISQQFPILSILTWAATLSVGFYLVVARGPIWWLVVVALIACGLAVFTGARVHLFTVLVFLLFGLAARGRRVRSYWLVVLLAPALVLATLFRFFLRASAWYGAGGFSDFLFDRGGIVGSIFASDEMSIAEVFTHGLFEISSRDLARFPFEGLVGLLMSPLPRSLLPWKPLAFSSEYTDHVSPGIWAASRSQLVTGPFLELHYEFWYFAPLFVVGIGILWGYSLRRIGLRSTRPHLWYAVATLAMFTFLRTDMQTIAVLVIPLAIVIFLWRAGAMMIGSAVPGSALQRVPESPAALRRRMAAQWKLDTAKPRVPRYGSAASVPVPRRPRR